MAKKIRIGILGGSFNPPHSGHLFISNQAIKKLNLLQLWWIVSPQNPLKSENIKNSFAHRMDLCKKIIRNNPKIKVKDLEYRFFKNSKNFYSYNFLKRLNQRFKGHEFFFIIGADNFAGMHEWYKYEQLQKMAKIVIFDRPGYKNKALNSKAARKVDYQFFEGKTIDVSSTALRRNRN